MENRVGGLEKLQGPRELVLLNGAPGSGKGANALFIEQNRGLERTVCVSSLLASREEARAAVQSGSLVSDAVVLDEVLGALLDPARGALPSGAVVDGFPRSAQQVDQLLALNEKLNSLHITFADHPLLAPRWPRPSIRVVCLFVDEAKSIARQMERGELSKRLRDRAVLAGVHGGGAFQPRATDSNEDFARHRYAVFRAHYGTLLKLKSVFAFTLVDASGTIAETQAQIARELRYQSSLELSAQAYDAVRTVPLSTHLASEARRALVCRLDQAARRHGGLLREVVHKIETAVLPVMERAALSGRSTFTSSHELFDDTLAPTILADVLSDRGFGVEYELVETSVPERVCLTTGVVSLTVSRSHRFHILCDRASLRHVTKDAGPAAALLPVVSFEPPMARFSPTPAVPAPAPPPSPRPYESDVSDVVQF